MPPDAQRCDVVLDRLDPPRSGAVGQKRDLPFPPRQDRAPAQPPHNRRSPRTCELRAPCSSEEHECMAISPRGFALSKTGSHTHTHCNSAYPSDAWMYGCRKHALVRIFRSEKHVTEKKAEALWVRNGICLFLHIRTAQTHNRPTQPPLAQPPGGDHLLQSIGPKIASPGRPVGGDMHCH